MSFSRTQLKALAIARKGPLCRKIGDLDDRLCDDLLAFYNQNKHQDLIKTAIAQRAQRSLSMSKESAAYLMEGYGQIALQDLHPGAEDTRKNYTLPVNADLVARVETLTGPSYRMRLSCLESHKSIEKHIDDPEQIRALAIVSGEHCFQFFVEGESIHVEMSRRELWFVNTAFEHQVENTGSVPRVALLVNLFNAPFLAQNHDESVARA